MRKKNPGLTPAGLALSLFFALGACGSGGGGGGAPPPDVVFANRVIDYQPVIAAGVTEADWPFFFQPGAVIGAPGGVFSVASLGYDPAAQTAPGGFITVGMGNPGDAALRSCIVDGPGEDLAVYENPFRTGDLDGDPATSDPGTNSEVATLELSEDNLQWFQFTPAVDASRALQDPDRYTHFAGVTPTGEGGDRFDLGSLIAEHGLPADFRACYARLRDGGTLHEDFGNTQTDLTASGADIDALEALHHVPAPSIAP